MPLVMEWVSSEMDTIIYCSDALDSLSEMSSEITEKLCPE